MTQADFFNALALALQFMIIIGLILAFMYLAFEEEREEKEQ